MSTTTVSGIVVDDRTNIESFWNMCKRVGAEHNAVTRLTDIGIGIAENAIAAGMAIAGGYMYGCAIIAGVSLPWLLCAATGMFILAGGAMIVALFGWTKILDGIFNTHHSLLE